MLFILLFFASSVFSKTIVHIVLHSHNDAGWRIPVSSYYESSVKKILNTMIDQLSNKSDLKYTWCETIFLKMYLDQYPSQKPKLIKLLQNQQLEIVGGGWVQNDEALPDFDLVLRQMRMGLQYLKDELNVSSVKVGWQLDSFGHSSLTAALWEKMGFEELVFSRVEEKFRVRET